LEASRYISGIPALVLGPCRADGPCAVPGMSSSRDMRHPASRSSASDGSGVVMDRAIGCTFPAAYRDSQVALWLRHGDPHVTPGGARQRSRDGTPTRLCYKAAHWSGVHCCAGEGPLPAVNLVSWGVSRCGYRESSAQSPVLSCTPGRDLTCTGCVAGCKFGEMECVCAHPPRCRPFDPLLGKSSVQAHTDLRLEAEIRACKRRSPFARSSLELGSGRLVPAVARDREAAYHGARRPYRYRAARRPAQGIGRCFRP